MNLLTGVGLLASAGGLAAGASSLVALRRCRTRLDQAREEFLIMMRQQQTEYRDGLGEVHRSVAFLEQSARSIEDAVKGRLTSSVRSQAMQLLRAGIPPDKAAVTLGLGKGEMRLIARVSRILSAQ